MRSRPALEVRPNPPVPSRVSRSSPGRLANPAALFVLLGLLLASCQRAGPVASLTPATPLPSASITPSLKSPAVLPPEIEPALEKGQLRAYYNKKYSQKEFDAVSSVVQELFPSYTPAEKRQAIAEILAFSYVVFHETEYHKLKLNHAALRRHEKTLMDTARRYQVPPLAVMAIVSWENSGGISKVSAADAAGLGQMTEGAIETAHEYAHQEAGRMRIESTSNPAGVEPMAKYLESIEYRHQKAARVAKLPDERFVPECNLEDMVLFFRFLLGQVGGRVDHAIGSYHKGAANTDDILYDYLTRTEGEVVRPGSDRTDFLAALERRNVTYLSVWNDPRTRQMLNGLRTMDGEVTTPDNRSQALGDESDIYPWKVLGSLAAYRQGADYVDQQVKRYAGPQSEVETRGLPVYESLAALKKAIQEKKLLQSRAPLADYGYRSGYATEYVAYSDFITPELEGYLFSLVSRWRKTAGQADLLLPVKTLMNTRAMSLGGYGLFSRVQMKGVTCLIAPQDLPDAAKDALRKVLEVDFLNDRIYRSTLDSGDVLITLNPRFGHQFLAAYNKYRADR